MEKKNYIIGYELYEMGGRVGVIESVYGSIEAARDVLKWQQKNCRDDDLKIYEMKEVE